MTAWTWFDREDLARAELRRLGGDPNTTAIRGAPARTKIEAATAAPTRSLTPTRSRGPIPAPEGR
jgi:hypothetical protein